MWKKGILSYNWWVTPKGLYSSKSYIYCDRDLLEVLNGNLKMAELNIYNLEKKEGTRGEYWLVSSDLGKFFAFPNSFEGDFETMEVYKDKLIDCDFIDGEYPQLIRVNNILGKAKEKVRLKDKDWTISRVACVNSAIKMIEASEETPTIIKTPTIVFNLAEEIFKFINK